LRDTVAAERKINPADLDLFRLTDDPAEAVAVVMEARQEELAGAGAARHTREHEGRTA